MSLWRILLILLPEPHNIFRDRQHIAYIYLLLNEGRKIKSGRKQGKNSDDEGKKLCVTYTRRWMMNKCYIAWNRIVQRAYISLVHATNQYRREIIYNELREIERNKWEVKSYENQGEKCTNLGIWCPRAVCYIRTFRNYIRTYVGRFCLMVVFMHSCKRIRVDACFCKMLLLLRITR